MQSRSKHADHSTTMPTNQSFIKMNTFVQSFNQPFAYFEDKVEGRAAGSSSARNVLRPHQEASKSVEKDLLTGCRISKRATLIQVSWLHFISLIGFWYQFSHRALDRCSVELATFVVEVRSPTLRLRGKGCCLRITPP